MIAVTNTENLRQYKSRFSLIVEPKLTFGSSFQLLLSSYRSDRLIQFVPKI